MLTSFNMFIYQKFYCCCCLSKAQADMTREGEDVAAVDKDAVLKNLEKTLHLLLERLEKMKTGNLL